jgi:hypothetical protein
LLIPKQYSTTAERIHAYPLSEANLAEVARWVGGRIVENTLEMYTKDGLIVVGIGDYVCKDETTGENFAMHPDKFNAKYHELGLRNREFEGIITGEKIDTVISRMATEAMQGKYGNGEERKRRLGVNYDAVQAEINNRVQNRATGGLVRHREGPRRV